MTLRVKFYLKKNFLMTRKFIRGHQRSAVYFSILPVHHNFSHFICTNLGVFFICREIDLNAQLCIAMNGRKTIITNPKVRESLFQLIPIRLAHADAVNVFFFCKCFCCWHLTLLTQLHPLKCWVLSSSEASCRHASCPDSNEISVKGNCSHFENMS